MVRRVSSPYDHKERTGVEENRRGEKEGEFLRHILVDLFKDNL